MIYSSATVAIIKAVERGSDMAASAVFPAPMLSNSWQSYDAAGEPYIMKTNGAKPNKILIFTHSWSSDLNQAKSPYYVDLMNMENAVVVSPNFGGPNNTSGAMGSLDSTDRIARVITEVKYKTGLSRVYVAAFSGGGLAAWNLLGRRPDLGIHRMSIWSGIYDLASVFSATSNQELKSDMVTVLGSAPADPDDVRYLDRSPRSCIQNFDGRPTVFVNVGRNDTEVPMQQGKNAAAAMVSACPGADVRVQEWDMAHDFKPFEALKQLVLE